MERHKSVHDCSLFDMFHVLYVGQALPPYCLYRNCVLVLTLKAVAYKYNQQMGNNRAGEMTHLAPKQTGVGLNIDTIKDQKGAIL